MRKLIRTVVLVAFAATLSALTGCTGMVQDELDATHRKLKDLQDYVADINDQLTNLERIVDALDDSHSIIPGSFTESEEGYSISFKDGTTVFIPYGKDGMDGRTLIPVGVRNDEDGHYYWTVDGEWFLVDSTMVRVDATDGVDGIAPQVKVEDGYWWISFDGSVSFTQLASCDEMDGIGVFADHPDLSDPSKFVLVLWDGTRIEIPYYVPLKIAFDGPVMDTLVVAAGETLSIPYEVLMEGESSEPVIVTSGTDGVYFSRVVAGEEPGRGEVLVQAPDPFSEGYIVLSAYCEGYSAVKMISFIERQIPVESITVRLAAIDTARTFAYETNFEYEVLSITYPGSESDEVREWLEVIPDYESGTIVFKPTANNGDRIRTAVVTISPVDNPEFVISTFDVRQATENAISFDVFDENSAFSFDLGEMILRAPADGGEADIWMTTRPELPLSVDIPDGVDWVTASMTAEDGFWRLHINVEAIEPEDERSTEATIRVQFIGIPLVFDTIKIIQ